MSIKNAVCYSYSLFDKGPLAHLRIIGPLEHSGINIVNGITNDQIITNNISEVDIVILQREFPRKFDEYLKIMEIAHKKGKPVVFDLDDLLFFLPGNHPNRVNSDYGSALLPMFQVLLEADLVSVSTQKLHDILAEYNNNVVVLPNYCDDELWHLKPPVPKTQNKQSLTISYMGGDSHIPDLESITPALIDVIKHYQQKIRFHFLGVRPPDQLASLPQVKWIPKSINNYKEFATFFQAQTADIFIAPLVDNLFNRCKSPLKFFEYSALGVPGVFSHLNPYSDVITHGHDGMLASSLEDWTNCLTQLIEDEDLRINLAKNAQETIKLNWLLSRNAFRWKEAYQGVLEKPFSTIGRKNAGVINIVNTINPQLFETLHKSDTAVQILKMQIEEKDLSVQSLTGQVIEKEKHLIQKEKISQALLTQIAQEKESIKSLSSQVAQKQKAVHSLTAQVKEKDRAAQALMDEVKQKEEAAQALRDEVKQKEQAAQVLVVRVEQKEKSVKALSAQVVEKEQAAQALRAKLGEIFGSRAWQLIQFLYRIRVRLIPHGSSREGLARRLFYLFRPVRHPKVYSSKPQESTKVDNIQPVSQTPSQSQVDGTSIYVEAYQESLQSTQTALSNIEYVPKTENTGLPAIPPVKIIAFFLPQFHPIPENDAWWGKGFTEWTNVSKSIPQFIGHYQPHLPGELGFYDLRVPDVLRNQVEMAKKYGVYGFCFYYYWFNGKRLLEKPMDRFMSDPEIKFPFCICWANENWTRRWDGQENDILLAQEHTQKSDIEFIKNLEPALRHPSYIKINGRPIIIVYRTSLMKNAVKTVATWRKYCIENKLGNPYLLAAQTFGFEDPRPVEFDAAVEFPPHNISIPEITKGMKILNPDFSGKIYSYIDLVNKISSNNVEKPYKVFRTVAPSWDNAPRTPGGGHSYIFSTPRIYERWLEWASHETVQKNDPDERFVFVNAWNEWGEGTHLEPDRKFGYAYLQATADALKVVESDLETNGLEREVPFLSPNKVIKKHDTTLLLHIYYPELWDQIESYLGNLKDRVDLFVSIPTTVQFDQERVLAKFPNCYIYHCENRGRDIAPFLKLLPLILEMGYKFGIKLHTKKTVHREDGLQWLEDILGKLLGSNESILAAKNALMEKNVGMVSPSGHLLPSSFYWGATAEARENHENVLRLSKMAGLNNSPSDFCFVAGSMYWFRPSALKRVSDLPMDVSLFEPEGGQKDGTFAHAMERFLGLAIFESGYKIVEINQKGEVNRPGMAEINKRTEYPFALATVDGKPLEK